MLKRMDIHGTELAGMNGALFVVFMPDWWRLHLWVWWFWKCHCERYYQRVLRALTPRTRRDSYIEFVHGVMTLRMGTQRLDVRVWQERTKWLVWSPPTATRVAVDPNSPDYNLPSTTNVHPSERGM